MRKFQEKSCIQNQNIFFQSIFIENLAVNEVMWKNNSRAGQVTDENVGQSHCMLDT